MPSSALPISHSLVNEALRDGMQDARRVVEIVAPSVETALKTSVYHTAYAVSFGACFAGLAVSRLLPAQSVIHRGVQDGCQAAQERVDEVFPPTKAKEKKTCGKGNSTQNRKAKRAPSGSAVRRARGEITATALRITEDTSTAHG